MKGSNARQGPGSQCWLVVLQSLSLSWHLSVPHFPPAHPSHSLLPPGAACMSGGTAHRMRCHRQEHGRRAALLRVWLMTPLPCWNPTSLGTGILLPKARLTKVGEAPERGHLPSPESGVCRRRHGSQKGAACTLCGDSSCRFPGPRRRALGEEGHSGEWPCLLDLSAPPGRPRVCVCVCVCVCERVSSGPTGASVCVSAPLSV